MPEHAPFKQTCLSIIQSLGLGSANEITRFTPLTGGVSSDIALVELGGQQICIKCALPQLKVQATWRAPLRRNLAEYRWLSFVAQILPDAVPELLGRDAQANGFAMAYLSPDQAWLYKAALLEGRSDDGQAKQTGAALARIHSASTSTDFERNRFDNAPDFYALRLEPYLDYTATRHPEHRDKLTALSRSFDSARIALIHGDVSPKNLLIRESGPVFLDAECATFGDPAFDTGFFTNHLIIKAVHLPAQAGELIRAVREFWAAYAAGVTWETIDQVEQRTCALLPALMLARVDGKSPVEYLDESGAARLRALSLDLLTIGYDKFDDLLNHITGFIQETPNQ